LLEVPAAQAYNLCMSTPVASFEGGGTLSPDGRALAVGGRLISTDDLHEIGRLPPISGNTTGIFSADSRRYLFLSGVNNGAAYAALDIIDIAAPNQPAHHLDFTSGPRAQTSPNGAILRVTSDEVDRPDAEWPGGKHRFSATQFLRTADGLSLGRIDRRYEAMEWAFDAKEQQHAILFLHDYEDDKGEVDLMDLQSGQIRGVANQHDGAVAMSPDGTIAVSSDFKTGRTTFWDTASGNALGTLPGITGVPAITNDSNWFAIRDIAVRRGEWSKPYRLSGLSDMAHPFRAYGNRLVAGTNDGSVVEFEGATQQPAMRSAPIGEHDWESPFLSPGNEYVAWSSTTNQVEKDKAMATSQLVILDGRSGNLLCQRQIGQPAEFRVLGLTAQHVAVAEDDGHQHKVVRLYAIESEDAARTRVQREAVQAKATSAKLAPAKRAEAQGIFKQAFDLFQSGEFASAARLFETGLAIDPGNPPANYYLGETYARMGDKDRAAVAYTRAAAIAPNTKEGSLATTRLAN
jgi:hypothetical protein